ncbi:uncharacterized protein NECHADRAFT_85058 [Fusarium vanettenii 77-13-4]|uniref:Nephrocystin 3-like N-terminal domain-containing protein n=1 Tax=Fusarium vanettenii (strain ATCC MYA-4622 / CBS 123669 / FGSC 9596 / NRRL 45880 / 77-13-4) TaxID=660122 RepID=C7YUV9_FUSV7|nr:uncharacterized protein NECHADRAFT_85058 [Fusarium vanettenii 77-13-4]EEU44874.1 hypothetical protein NECHADRAFT_85058 [Fusarium vanettenii 77-13-4]
MSATHMGRGDMFHNAGTQNICKDNGTQIIQNGPDEEADLEKQDDRCLKYMRHSGYVPEDQKINAERRKEQLFEPACEWIFKSPEFQQWRDGASAPGLWLHGGPGKGKTKLLCSVLNHLLDSIPVAPVSSDPSLLVTYSFFSNPDGDREASFVVATLLHGLVKQQPSYLRRISKVYDHETKYPFRGKRAFTALAGILKDMLEDMLKDNPTRTRIILVVDALDECETDANLDHLLDLILETSSIQNVRWFVSSRGLPIIHQKFDAPDTKMRKLSLDQTGEDIQQALQAYINHRMGSLHRLRMSGEKKEELQNRLLRKAGGTFLWLSIVMAELKKGNSWNTNRVVEGLSGDLKSLYESLLQNLLGDLVLGGDSEIDKEVFHKTLATTTAALRPLHIEELKELVGFPEEIDEISQVEEVIDKCGAFLTRQNNQVFLIHLSAKEFLTPEKLQSAFQSNPLDIHSHLFSRSMSVMEENLKRDIYNLEKPGIDIRDIAFPLSPDPLLGLKYFCVHWIDHLERVQLRDYQAVRRFIEKSLLHWLEAMSLQRKMEEACRAVQKLCRLMQNTKDYELDTFTNDIDGFVQVHEETIQNYPFQTYASALLFSPTSSCVRRVYSGEELDWISLKSKREPTWSPRAKSLSMLAPTSMLAISTDGNLLASINDPDCVGMTWEDLCEWALEREVDYPHAQLPPFLLQIWDLNSNEQIQILGIDFEVLAIGFLRDSKRLALAGNQNRFEIWSAETGSRVQTLQSPEEPSVCFTCLALPTSTHLDLNEDVIASGSDNGAVRFWNPATGGCTRSIRTSKEKVGALTFSQDGQKLAVGLLYGTIEVWDFQSESLVGKVKAHNRSVVSMAFLGDDQLASTSKMEGVRIWDLKTGACAITISVHTEDFTMVVSLGNGGYFASSTEDFWGKVRVWNNKGEFIHHLEGSDYSMNGLVFCPEKQLLAHATEDTVDIWDLKLFPFAKHAPLHMERVLSTTLSSDYLLLASGSEDSIKIWNTATGTCIRSMGCLGDGGSGLAFSPNTRYLVSRWGITLWEERWAKLTVWSVSDGQAVKTFYEVRGWEVFSPDDKLLALALRSSVMVWDMDASEEYRQIQRSATCLVFSADGNKLALASDTKLEIWDMLSGECIWAVAHQQTEVTSIALSADAELLAVGTSQQGIHVCGCGRVAKELRVSMATSQRFRHTLDAVAFSPNRELLAWVRGGEIGMWNFKDRRVSRFSFDGGKRRSEFSGRATIQFEPPDYSRLCTSIGDLDINAEGTITGFHGYHLDKDHEWIVRDGKKMVLLPKEYRGGPVLVAEARVFELSIAKLVF